MQELPDREAYVASIPDAEGFVRMVFALADRIRDIPQLAAQIPATTGDWSSFTNYFASAGGSGTLFNEGQRLSTPPPINKDGDITLDPQTPKAQMSGRASNAPPQGSRPSGPRPLPNPLVAPRQQPKKPEVQFARVGPPPPINRATKPKKSYASTLGQGPKRPVTIAQVAKVMPQLPLEAVAGPSRGQASGPSNARKCKKGVPSFIAGGPSRRQVLIGFGTGSDITCDFNLFIRRARTVLRDGGSSLQILSMEYAYTGYALHTDGVASEKDLEFI
ncbi:hypothetical protein CPC08DRAFT_771854 [Agrocybe pediades]|nr:hypothetical protein CPC08DRAFT_771854 [Agrocybe pediades]